MKTSLSTLADRLKSTRDPLTVACGLRPSGNLHTGNLFVVACSALLASKVFTSEGQVRITICDIERPSKGLWDVQKHGFVRYFEQLPVTDGANETNELERTVTEVQGIASYLSFRCKVPISVVRLSELSRQKGYRQAIYDVLRGGAMQVLFPQWPEKNGVPIYPLCSSCQTSDPFPVQMEDTTLFYECKNPECDQYAQQQTMDLFDTSRPLPVHFLLTKLKDIACTPTVDVHAYGGDYKTSHAGAQSRIEKIDTLFDIVANGKKRPLLYTGPTFSNVGNTAMHKSQMSQQTVAQLYKATDGCLHPVDQTLLFLGRMFINDIRLGVCPWESCYEIDMNKNLASPSCEIGPYKRRKKYPAGTNLALRKAFTRMSNLYQTIFEQYRESKKHSPFVRLPSQTTAELMYALEEN